MADSTSPAPGVGGDPSLPRTRPSRDNPAWGPWHEPAFIIVAGDSGTGKSTDALLSFAGEALCIAQEGGLKPAWSVGHVDLEATRQRKTIHTIEEATGTARWLGEHPEAGVGALVVDDLSLLMKNSYRQVAKVNPPVNRRGEINLFEVWDRIGDLVLEFAQCCRWAGLHVVCGAHLRPPETAKDPSTGVLEFFKGGPELPSRKLTRQVPYFADVVYTVGVAPGREPWPGVYRCLPADPSWHMKDRHDVIRGEGPMNLGEILRSVGYRLRRPRGLEWQEQVAEEVAAKILAGEPAREVCARAAHVLYHRHAFHPDHIRWAAHRDGVDRAVLRQAAAARLGALGIGATLAAGPAAPASAPASAVAGAPGSGSGAVLS